MVMDGHRHLEGSGRGTGRTLSNCSSAEGLEVQFGKENKADEKQASSLINFSHPGQKKIGECRYLKAYT